MAPLFAASSSAAVLEELAKRGVGPPAAGAAAAGLRQLSTHAIQVFSEITTLAAAVKRWQSVAGAHPLQMVTGQQQGSTTKPTWCVEGLVCVCSSWLAFANGAMTCDAVAGVSVCLPFVSSFEATTALAQYFAARAGADASTCKVVAATTGGVLSIAAGDFVVRYGCAHYTTSMVFTLCCACASPSCQSGVEVLLKQFNGIPSWVAIAVRCVLTGSPQSILANAENIANGVLNSLVKDPAARKQMTAAARLIIGIVKALDSSGVSGLRQQR